MHKKHIDILKRFYKKDKPYSNMMVKGITTNREILVYDGIYESEGSIIIDEKKPSGEIPVIDLDFRNDHEEKIDLTIARSKELHKFFKLMKSFRVMYKDGLLSLVCPDENIMETNFKLGTIEFTVDIEYLTNALAYINTRETEMVKIVTGDNYLIVSTYDELAYVVIAFKVSHAWGGEKACFSTFQE